MVKYKQLYHNKKGKIENEKKKIIFVSLKKSKEKWALVKNI